MNRFTPPSEQIPRGQKENTFSGYLDRDQILEIADPLVVAEYIGLATKKVGNRISILCPGHEERLGHPDNHFGNCYLTPHGYHCYSCGASVGLIDMVMEVTGEPYAEALGIIGDCCGGRELFYTDKRRIRETLPVNLDDLKTIGLDPKSGIMFDSVNVVNAQEAEHNDGEYRIWPHYFLDGDHMEKENVACTATAAPSLFTLYKEDPEAYNYLLSQKAVSALWDAEDHLRNDTACFKQFPPLNMVDPDLLHYEMMRLYQDKYFAAKRILSSLGVDVKDEPSKKATPRFRVIPQKQEGAPF